jgi:hypothetical protein
LHHSASAKEVSITNAQTTALREEKLAPLITVSAFLLARNVSGLFLSPEKVSSLEDCTARRFVVMILAVQLEGTISHMYVITTK